MQKSAMCTKLNKQFASGFAFVWFGFPAYGKKKLFPAKGKVSTLEKETPEPQQKRLQTDSSALHASS